MPRDRASVHEHLCDGRRESRALLGREGGNADHLGDVAHRQVATRGHDAALRVRGDRDPRVAGTQLRQQRLGRWATGSVALPDTRRGLDRRTERQLLDAAHRDQEALVLGAQHP